MIRAIFWDNDGVLVDTERLYFQASQEILKETGIVLEEKQFQNISLKEGRSVFDLALEKGVLQPEVDRLREVRNRRYTELLTRGIHILDGVRETLDRLRGKMSHAVVTSSRRIHFDTMHSHTGLLPYFDFVLTSEDFQRSKPDPEPYLRALVRSGLRPEECLVIEDSERGLHAAMAAGIHCIVIPNDLTCEGDFHGAWRVFNSCRQIPDEIKMINEENREKPI